MVTPKPPSQSVRAELTALVQTRIMRAVADVISAGNDEITFRALAEASGVPERTIYRYYPTKESVLSAFWIWMNERLGMPPKPTSPSELVAQVPALFGAFERDALLVRAMLHHPSGRATRLDNTKARQAKLQSALGEMLAEIGASDRRRLVAAVQVLFSAAGWETMKDYCGLTGAEAADAAQWGIGVLLAEAQRSSRKSRGPASVTTARVSPKKRKEN